MKKLLILFVIFICIISLNFLQEQFLHDVFMFEASSFHIYLNDNKIDFEEGEITQNGNGEIVEFNRMEMMKNLHKLNNIAGESVIIQNVDLSDLVIKLKLKIINENTIGGNMVLLGYSNKLKGFLKSDGKKFNVQIKFCGNYAVVGYPLIMQGF